MKLFRITNRVLEMKKLTNKEIEKIAIDFIKSKYKKAKKAKDGSGYDLEIGNRIVEVKATTTDNYRQNIFLSRNKEYEAFKKENYWLFRVFNVGKPIIDYKEIPGKKLRANPDPRWRLRILH